jgi:hypothetical protein
MPTSPQSYVGAEPPDSAIGRELADLGRRYPAGGGKRLTLVGTAPTMKCLCAIANTPPKARENTPGWRHVLLREVQRVWEELLIKAG